MPSIIAGVVLLGFVLVGPRRDHEQLRPQQLVDVVPAPPGYSLAAPAGGLRPAAAGRHRRDPDRRPAGSSPSASRTPSSRSSSTRGGPTGSRTASPNIVQDAIVIGLFALAATLFMPDKIVATTAVGAVVIGFALQDTLGNLFAGLAIQIEKPFRVGHWVTIGGIDGWSAKSPGARRRSAPRPATSSSCRTARSARIRSPTTRSRRGRRGSRSKSAPATTRRRMR